MNKRRLEEDRKKETEDSPAKLAKKCAQLSKAIQKAKNLVVYTGAGISTAANIPGKMKPFKFRPLKFLAPGVKFTEVKTTLGSEIRTILDFEWSKRGWVANSLDFEWDLKSGSPSI